MGLIPPLGVAGEHWTNGWLLTSCLAEGKLAGLRHLESMPRQPIFVCAPSPPLLLRVIGRSPWSLNIGARGSQGGQGDRSGARACEPGGASRNDDRRGRAGQHVVA